MREISIRDARRVGLHRQGLLRAGGFGSGKPAVQRVIERLGYVQIDTISVVDRAHDHVIKTRVPGYTGLLLDDLVRRDRTVFEYWAHAAAYLPMAEFRFSLPMMEGFARARQAELDEGLAADVIARIRHEGPRQSRDFDPPDGRRPKGWWDWKPAKRTLEHLFLSGRLLISHREGFQKVYDLPENVLPADIDTTMPSPHEWHRHLVLRVLRGFGIATARHIASACRTAGRWTQQPLRDSISAAIDALVEDGFIEPVLCSGRTWYTLQGELDALPSRLPKKAIRFLSPFDHAVIDRSRTFDLFGFEYQIECYVPAPKRTYGYYCLPILWGDEFIGRMDAKAARSAGRFEVRGLFLEPDVTMNDRLATALNEGIRRLARAHGCAEVEMPHGSQPHAGNSEYP